MVPESFTQLPPSLISIQQPSTTTMPLLVGLELWLTSLSTMIST
jgi:hypothetical protein